jgi:23S rRNA pseudouridine1911/1915/1917 synthase
MADAEHECAFRGNRAARLDILVRDHLGGAVSREKIKKWILGGLCQVDGTVCRDPAARLPPLSQIRLILPEERTALEAEPGDVSLIWQDASLMVVNKPAGLTVHPAPSCPQGTLIQRLLALCPQLRSHEGWRPGIVHRLDKDTSGLLLVAPGESARLKLAGAFARREVEKIYLALVAGRIQPRQGECLAPLGRHPVHKIRMAVVPGGRPAHTLWDTLYVDRRERFSLLAVRLHTGRTHQIRVHMAHLGHPLLGDALYAPGSVAALAPRQMLHAWKLAFRHPLEDRPLSFICPPPEDMPATMADISGQTLCVVITGLPGCGKSLLRQYLHEQGFPVWSADDVVRRCYEPGRDGWQILHHRYRGRFTPDNRPVDTASLALAMRQTPGLRAEIEALIHPLVYEDLCAFWDTNRNMRARLAFAEVPLWLESGGNAMSGRGPQPTLVGVACPACLRHDRLVRLRGWDPDMASAADSWQWPEEKKMAACEYVVDNSGDVAHLHNEARRLLERLLAARACHVREQRQAWDSLWGTFAGALPSCSDSM